LFAPERVIFERQALNYPLGDRLYQEFDKQGLELGFTSSHNQVRSIPGKNRQEKFFQGKRTLVVGIRRSQEFATCRPSAHYQLPLCTGCPGLCEYCYLLTNLSRSPYVRIYVNLEQILERAGAYIRDRLPEPTVFEGAATSDPLAVEPYSGSLARAIEFFAEQPRGRFRLVTKFDDVDSLLPLQHRGATRFRFSLNTEAVIRHFEHGTPPLAARLSAARKVAEAGYPLGFMIAPIIAAGGPAGEQHPGAYDPRNWERDYSALFEDLAPFSDVTDLTFELITHRFTTRAKCAIQELFPHTRLPLEESERRFKWGQFGYGKYIFNPELQQQVAAFLRSTLSARLPQARLEYLV
jgi:spore photoproduct lyase